MSSTPKLLNRVAAASDRIVTATERSVTLSLDRAAIALAVGQAVIVNAEGRRSLTVIAGAAAGTVVTVSRVDAANAPGANVVGTDAAVTPAHTTGAENSFTVAAGARTVTTIDWPFYRVSVAVGTARIGLV